MFTGLIEAVGTVTEVVPEGAQAQLVIASPGFGADLQHGESIAVDGVCLTVAGHQDGQWVVDVMRVTRETTTLGAIAPGTQVNLERAMRADGRLGGHIVQGHVDGIATLVAHDVAPEWHDLTFELPPNIAKYIVAKGSIALNGVSLTVAAVEGNRVAVSLIPVTLADTTLGRVVLGSQVNVEVDVVAKYVERLLAERP